MFNLAYCCRPIWLSLVLLATGAFAQESLERSFLRPSLGREGLSESAESDELETDRDSFTPSTNIVGQKRLVLESSYSFIDNRNVYETHSLPEILARYGILPNVELRFGVNYEVGGAGSPIAGNVPKSLEARDELEHESRLLYGTKVFLTDQEAWLPQSSFILQGFTPTSGETTATTISASYVFGWEIHESFVWDSSIRYSSGLFEEDRFDIWSPSTVIKVPLGEKWKVHAEYFGIFSDGREPESNQHFFSPGAHYLITRNLEIGTRVGWGLNAEAPNFFSNLGMGIRF